MIKFREATKHFMGKNETGGVRMEMRFCIECLHNRQWRLFGDDNGPYKFKTREERDAKLAELRAGYALNAGGLRTECGRATH